MDPLIDQKMAVQELETLNLAYGRPYNLIRNPVLIAPKALYGPLTEN